MRAPLYLFVYTCVVACGGSTSADPDAGVSPDASTPDAPSDPLVVRVASST